MSTFARILLRNNLDRFHELRRFLHSFGDVGRLLQPEQLTMRLNALDELDTILGGFDPGALTGCSDRAVMADARALKTQFETANAKLYQAAHAEIAIHGNSSALAYWLRDTTRDGKADARRPGLSFDLLDEIVSGVLQLCGPGGATPLPSPEMTAYQPTPTRHILDLIAACKFASDDILVDLGSGLGHVPLLVCILAGIRTLGVEVQTDHASSAEHAAQRLNLSRVRFVAEDARTTDLSDGTVFYMFTPFTGSILTEVLHRLQTQSKTRPITICALGPCTRLLQGQTWLEANYRPDTERITVFKSL